MNMKYIRIDRSKVNRLKELFEKFRLYPTTANKEEYRAELGAADGPEYWLAYNEYYNTDYPVNVKTIRL